MSASPVASDTVFPIPVQAVSKSLDSGKPRVPCGIALVSTLCCVFLALAVFRQHEEMKHLCPAARSVDPLWSPMFTAGKEIFICLGHADPLKPNNPEIELTSGELQRITVTDLKAYTNIGASPNEQSILSNAIG